jgi:hypothetical protein
MRILTFTALLLPLAALPAFGDLISVTSPNGLYTADITSLGGRQLFIAGPNGTVTYDADFNMLPWLPGLLINNYGEVAGASDGGTSDPVVYYALYYGSDGGFVGTSPVIFGDDSGFLPLIGCPGIGCGPYAYGGRPTLLSLTDSGLLSAFIDREPYEPNVVQQWQLPDEVPEPASISLLGIAFCLSVLKSRGLAGKPLDR